MTSLRWIGVRQTDVSLVIEDRPTARIAAPPGVRARKLPGPIEPASCKDGPELHTGGIDRTGIDIRRHRCSKGPGGRRRPPYRPEVGCLLRRDRGWGTGRPTGGPGSCLGAAGGVGRPGTAIGGSSGSCGAARSRRQPSSGSRLRQGHRDSGKDRRLGRGRPGPLRRRRSSLCASSTGCRDPGTQLVGCPPAPGDDHAGLGEEPPGHRHQRRPAPHRGTHRLVGAGVGRP